MDPFVVLGAVAAVTRHLKVATGICLVPQRDPIQTAKSVATIDHLSQGRFLFGVGAGWNAEEMADHGTDFKRRNDVLRERLEAMRAIWTQTKPEYHGDFVAFGPMMTWPKPVQKPHPPVLVGGGMPYGARRALAFGDGWMPHARRPHPAHHGLWRGARPGPVARLSRGWHRAHRAQPGLGRKRLGLATARSLGGQDRRRRLS